ncbi:hypothetical protein PUN28_004145 [Cardiocondyla obscurior]|uniref:Uncharacterized protein n=1 Tax=Cardiocondyla obscurior TaxID=286306 RepID=A0AAW2GPR5_9HYME
MSVVIIKQNNRFHCENKRVLCLYCVITVALHVVKSLQNYNISQNTFMKLTSHIFTTATYENIIYQRAADGSDGYKISPAMVILTEGWIPMARRHTARRSAERGSLARWRREKKEETEEEETDGKRRSLSLGRGREEGRGFTGITEEEDCYREHDSQLIIVNKRALMSEDVEKKLLRKDKYVILIFATSLVYFPDRMAFCPSYITMRNRRTMSRLATVPIREALKYNYITYRRVIVAAY